MSEILFVYYALSRVGAGNKFSALKLTNCNWMVFTCATAGSSATLTFDTKIFYRKNSTKLSKFTICHVCHYMCSACNYGVCTISKEVLPV